MNWEKEQGMGYLAEFKGWEGLRLADLQVASHKAKTNDVFRTE